MKTDLIKVEVDEIEIPFNTKDRFLVFGPIIFYVEDRDTFRMAAKSIVEQIQKFGYHSKDYYLILLKNECDDLINLYFGGIMNENIYRYKRKEISNDRKRDKLEQFMKSVSRSCFVAIRKD